MNKSNIDDKTSQYPDYYQLFYPADEEEWIQDPVSAMIRVAFVLLSRVGFILVQAGSIHVENIYVIIWYNLIQIAVVFIFYGLIGCRLSFGPDTRNGWISKGGWTKEFSFEFDLENVVIGFCGCLLATAQMGTFLVGRINLIGGIILTAFYCTIFQPLLMHWIWAEEGWMRLSEFLNYEVFVKDHGGVLVLHIPSIIFGMIGAVFLGRRIMKLKDVDKLSYGSENTLTIFLGYLLIILGYIIFALPSTVYEEVHIPPPYNVSAVIALNSLLAIGGGIIMSTILQLITFRHIYHYRRSIRCVQGGLAGVISVSAAVDRYTPISAIAMSFGSTTLFFFFAEIIHSTWLEDPCSFISSHLICGLVGVIMCPLLARRENFVTEVPTTGVHLIWQLICVAVVVGFSILVALFVFLILKVLHLLRDDHETANHKRATVLRDSMTKRSFLERLFPVNTTTDYVKPGYKEEFLEGGGQVERQKKELDGTYPVGDTLRKRDHHDNKFTVGVGMVNTELGDSGDFYDPYLDIKSLDSKISKTSSVV